MPTSSITTTYSRPRWIGISLRHGHTRQLKLQRGRFSGVILLIREVKVVDARARNERKDVAFERLVGGDLGDNLGAPRHLTREELSAIAARDAHTDVKQSECAAAGARGGTRRAHLMVSMTAIG